MTVTRTVKKASRDDFLCLIELNDELLQNKIVVALLKPLIKPIFAHSRDINRGVREFKGRAQKPS